MLTYKALLQKYEKALAGVLALLRPLSLQAAPNQCNCPLPAAFLTSIPTLGKVNLPRVWEAVEGTTICEPAGIDLSQAHPYRHTVYQHTHWRCCLSVLLLME